MDMLENLALGYAKKLREWYNNDLSQKCRKSLSKTALAVLSHHFNHFVALYLRPSLWLATGDTGKRNSTNGHSVSLLFRSSAMIIDRSINGGGPWVRLFKQPFESAIRAKIKVDRYSRWTASIVDKLQNGEDLLKSPPTYLTLRREAISLLESIFRSLKGGV
jgi:hypothetical protein